MLFYCPFVTAGSGLLVCKRRFSFHEFYNFCYLILYLYFFFRKTFLIYPRRLPTTHYLYPLPTTHGIQLHSLLTAIWLFDWLKHHPYSLCDAICLGKQSYKAYLQKQQHLLVNFRPCKNLLPPIIVSERRLLASSIYILQALPRAVLMQGIAGCVYISNANSRNATCKLNLIISFHFSFIFYRFVLLTAFLFKVLTFSYELG